MSQLLHYRFCAKKKETKNLLICSAFFGENIFCKFHNRQFFLNATKYWFYPLEQAWGTWARWGLRLAWIQFLRLSIEECMMALQLPNCPPAG